jgi:hypothetical protein
MTAEESLRMAREAGLLGLDAEGRLERFRKLAYEAGVRAEREACAKVCEDASKPREGEMHSDAQWAGLVLSAAIRARSKT